MGNGSRLAGSSRTRKRAPGSCRQRSVAVQRVKEIFIFWILHQYSLTVRRHLSPHGSFRSYRLGRPSGVPQLKTDDGVIALAADGHTLFVREAVLNAWTMRVVSVDINTGKRQLFKEIEPPDRAGVLALGPVHITPDGKTYVFGSRAGSQTCMSWKDYADSLRSMVGVAAPGTGCSFRHKKIAILAPAITTLAS